MLLGLFAATYVFVNSPRGRAVFIASSEEVPKLSVVANALTSASGPTHGEQLVTKEDHGIVADTPSLYSLSITSIKVKAKVDAVGLTSAGAMATAKNLSHIGWYKYSAKPGDVGTTVLAGHVNNQLLLPGTLYKLKNTKVGDDIYITKEDGTKFHYVITEFETFAYDAEDTSSVFRSTGEPVLKLITCTGSWLKEEHTYNKRLVVTATLVS